jgi:putative toxin-antitoxin system antitoxin component (TIGR02293 family)
MAGRLNRRSRGTKSAGASGSAVHGALPRPGTKTGPARAGAKTQQPKAAAKTAQPRLVSLAAAAEIRRSRAVAAGLVGLKDASTSKVVARLKAGLPYSALPKLAQASGLAVPEIARLADIPLRTLSRRKTQGKLQPAESERLLRLSNVFARALELFENDAEAATRWLTTPKKGLAGESPLEFATTEVGAREVEELLGRLEHGVYS